MELSWSKDKENFYILLDNAPFITISREAFKSLRKKKKKAKVAKRNITPEFFLKEYNKEKEKYYNRTFTTTIRKNTKQYKNIQEAARICSNQGATPKEMVAAVTDSLGFVNNGQGQFPRPSQLCTANAETSLIEYLNRGSMEKLSEERKEYADIPLKKNVRYKKIIEKIEDGDASKKEAEYAKKCELSRRGKMSFVVDSYLRAIKDE